MSKYKEIAILELVILLLILGALIIYLLSNEDQLSGLSFLTGK